MTPSERRWKLIGWEIVMRLCLGPVSGSLLAGLSELPYGNSCDNLKQSHEEGGVMARIFITGSTDGLGRATAQSLLGNGHHVFVHARSADRLTAVQDLLERGATGVVGDLSDIEQTRAVADQVNREGALDAVIHNAGVLNGARIFQVNVVAPYLLTALIRRPRRLIYLSSSMHRSGRAAVAGAFWSGQAHSVSYSDSKLCVTALAAAVARLWPDVLSNAVDPGWVPTRMGGPGAPDDLRLGHLTQEWLATSEDPEACTSGGYWHHQHREKAHPAASDHRFQSELVSHLARVTGERLS
ncbi:MAG: short-chain dehydrogenase [Arthrobacter sp.]|nr:short-chain dehydrogenase [Arthrobacter sp.]